ncbi:DUF3820 family protein [Pseudomaricurvus albidus]|uniref:DUF3820 family protein n=1 Tax=Pseudomaricurvus albidus TaxID=2842452 RepID=UPI003F6EE007
MAIPTENSPSERLSDELSDEQRLLLSLVRTKMPFGKYQGRLLADLPEAYVLWFEREGFPKGTLGRQLAMLHTIKVNGLESLLEPLRNGAAGQ